MKKIFLKITCIGFISMFALTSCGNTSEEKIEDAQEDVADAEQELREAETQLKIDYDNYKLETEKELLENEQRIEELRLEIKKEKVAATRAKREKELEELESRNETLRQKFQNFKYNAREDWETFKIDFNNEMQELNQSIKDFFTRDEVKK